MPDDVSKSVPLLVCVSGGADSVCLLVRLVEEGYRCIAAHCNFHLRGEESDEDERYVRRLTERLGVPLVRRDFDTKEYAERQHISIEMAARELRYRWFEEMREEQGCGYIAVAHNLNDSVETFFVNLVRGTGIKGLTGIRAVNGRIVRPLLKTTRGEIEEYIAERGMEYRTDSTNSDTKYRRNHIRHNILPRFAEMNPSFMVTMSETMENLRTAVARIEEPESGEARMYDLHEMLSPYGFTRERIVQVWQAEQAMASGKRFESGEVTVVVDRGRARIHKNRGSGEMTIRVTEVECGGETKSGAGYAFVDGDKVEMPLSVRRWREGDLFVPYGMRGRKRVSDVMTERKMDVVEKERQMVVTDARGDIVWVVGVRTDGRFAVDNKTVRVVKVSVEEKS